MKKIIIFATIIVVVVAAYVVYFKDSSNKLDGIVYGNGRSQVTFVDISSKMAGRIDQIFVDEGDLVKKGQLVATLETKELNAKLDEIEAHKKEALLNRDYVVKLVNEKRNTLDFVQKEFDRAKKLYETKAISVAEFQAKERNLLNSQTALDAAKIQVQAAEATILSLDAQANSINVQIDEAKLFSPVDGRVLYKLMQSKEIVPSGGKVLVILDLMDTYMDIFLPTSQVGVVDIGSEARILFDVIPNIAVPATVTFVSPDAQFTPKEIETKDERAKLMFKVRVKIEPEILDRYYERIKSGVPGVAYIKLDNDKDWPDFLSNLPKK